MPPQESNLKQQLRKKLKRHLATLSYDRDKIALALFQNLMSIDAIRNAQTVGIYVDFKTEAPTRQFLPKLFERNSTKTNTIAIPYCIGSNMNFYKLQYPQIDTITGQPIFLDLEPTAPFGILEPRQELRKDPTYNIDPEEIDVLITPGLGFDRAGRRLGRGAGFYDRYIPLLRQDALVVGICFDEQLIEEAPINEFDIPVSIVITPTQIIYAQR